MEYLLGKLPAIDDKRTLKFAQMLGVVLPVIPDTWNFDNGKTIPTPMFKNDAWGDCAIAGRAHMTLRFENFEQNQIIPITDDDVLAEYWLEQGAVPVQKKRFCKTVTTWSDKPDGGIYLLKSLNTWRQNGWDAAGRHYDIHGYAAIDWKNPAEVKTAIYLLTGVYAGILLPNSARSQTVWDVDDTSNGFPGGWGGHCVSIFQYNPDGLTCITWGRKQRMTWGFLEKYCDELFALVDNRDKFLTNSPVNIELLDSYLASL